MRLTILCLSLIAVALIGEIQTASAQSAYSYPWCSRYFKRGGGGSSCYYATYQQCMATVSGIGGYCFQSPYYRGPSNGETSRHRR
jgi:hypothetical protein